MKKLYIFAVRRCTLFAFLYHTFQVSHFVKNNAICHELSVLQTRRNTMLLYIKLKYRKIQLSYQNIAAVYLCFRNIINVIVMNNY